ncbi:hypothetical protein FA95DRAFT_819263 [Auriscalpium vulgare]|uniref:Uncharacterized protein n=1 Tax=Auriscalpium vulgare TaxID=40419 RepID=A0ACB8S0P2_9AGAM|nr:hypothetical protein FA95DRAFT_819263 [Auriscalpium vulgare]
MRLSTILGGSLLAVSVPWLALADAHAHAPARRHHEIANRPRGDLAKRFSNARFTFYDITTALPAARTLARKPL